MFATIIKFVLEHEGGYVNDPVDPGGATNMGITQRTLDSYNKRKGIPLYPAKELKLPIAINIYYEDYWKPEWEKLGFALAACMLDTAVNMGPGRAVEFLKKCNGDYIVFLQLRLARYDEIISKNPRLGKFKKGWMNRMADLRRFIDGELSNSGGSR